MRITGTFVLSLSLGAAVAMAGLSGYASAAKKGGGGGAAPTASSGEVAKLKAVRLGDPKAGTFKWGMKPEEVMAQAKTAVEAKYEARIDKARQDPGLQQRIRDEQQRELTAVKKSFTKFEGQKTGWDVSIIGPEFQQNTAEAVLVTKEDIWTRYFFFFEDGLYKMFLAFNKDAIGGKTFQEFGKGMEAKYGHAKEVYRDDKTRGGVVHKLDHYEWSAGGGDRLKLIYRSEFYGVYCLVLYDGSVQDRVVDRRKTVNPGEVKRDELVEGVTGSHAKEKSGDIDDDIIDRVVGKETKKPGADQGKTKDIVVDSANLPKSSSPSSSGGGEKKKAASASSSSSASSEEKESGSKKKGGKKSDNPMDGLEL
jgi:ribosome-binding protein aMBF1 (putative translation factor)